MATVPNMPRVADPHENRRMAHTRLRRRLLDGVFLGDLEDRILEHLGSQRTRMTGPPDLSGMFFGSLCRELSTLYLSPPTIHHQLEAATRTLTDAVAAAGLWPAMLRYQSWVVGCRDYAMRADVASDGMLTYRAVAPDCIVGDAPVDRPDQPYRLAELRERGGEWTWDVFDAADIDQPRHYICEAVEGRDPLECPLWDGPQPADDWPPLYRTADGVPVVPYVLHHAEVMTDRLWDPWAWLTVVEGSLNHSVLCSFWLHLVRDASWPQRYSIDLQLWGEGVDGDGADRLGEVVTDPASLLRFIATQDARSPTAGQFAPGGDPEATLRAIDNYAARIAQDAGISTSDMQRGGDPRSGYAISLSNEGKRSAQRRFAAPFQLADQRLMALSAVLLNRAHSLALPESGWEVAYAPIPLSPEELRSRREHALEMYDRGLATRVQTYMDLHPGVSRDRAVAELAQVDIERGATDDAGPSTTNASPREIAEMLQKLYLSVGTVITPEEARAVMNRAGAQLEGDPVLMGKPSPATVAMTEDDNG